MMQNDQISKKIADHPLRSAAAVFMAGALTAGCAQEAQEPVPNADRPNVIIIYADDVGFGDVGVYGSELIPTPHLDDLARSGMMMTSSYATSATCTPSRYSLLTGEYAFRNERAQILDGDAPLLIDPDVITLPDLFRQADYRTSIIGKWHLGIGEGDVDWNSEIKPGPLELGFDESFIIPTTTDRVPTVYVDGYHVSGLSPADPPLRVSYRERVGELPTGRSHPKLLRYPADGQHSGTIVDGISRIGWQDGGQSAWWNDEDMTLLLAEMSRDFIRENQDQPFFLFFSLHQNHVPRAPHPMFHGKSETGLRGDHTVELDWAVNEVMTILDDLDMRENTLVIFASDNGPIFDDGYDDGAIEEAHGHPASGPFRGGKYTAYEGGTRLPFIVNWPGVVSSGSVSDAMFSQVDLMASLAELIGVSLPKNAGPDSMYLLSALLGHSETGRPHVLQQGAGTGYFGLRKGDWKLIPASNRPAFANNKHNSRSNPLSTTMPASDNDYLFNLAEDPGETTNLAEQYPEIVEELTELLNRIKQYPDRVLISEMAE